MPRSRVRIPIRRVAVVVAALAVTGVVAPMSYAAEEPHTTVAGAYSVFNVPSTDYRPDYAIEDHLIELINETPAGEDIYGAMFSWTRIPVAEALRDAQARGVDVRLAIDKGGSQGTTNTDPDNVAIQTLKAADLTQLTFCEGPGTSGLQQTACISNREYSINHNKLFSFSKTGSMAEVVFSASQNMTNSQGNLFNNAVVIHGDAALYGFFARHFTNMLEQKKNNNYFNSPDGYYRTDDNSVTVYFSPRADSNGNSTTQPSTDTVNLLMGYIKDQPGPCTLDIVHAEFTNARIAVADQLVRIAKLGCKIRLVYGSMADTVYSRLSQSSNIEMKRYYDRASTDPEDPRDAVGVHSKYINFSGNYNGTPNRDIVFTGSQNLTGPSLRNHDETLLKVEIPAVTQGFADNFETVWSRARCHNPTSGSCPS
jgi:phosphatidylserine/phosphatidylglycerophosphate/cardiolipin synthase-like enzyme